MKKITAVILILCLATALLVSCGETPAVESSAMETTYITEETTTEETTTEAETTFVSSDPQIIDSLDSDYIIRTILDDKNKITGVSIWKYKGTPETITFASEYTLNGVSYPICEIGSAQGILDFPQKLTSVTIPGSVTKISNMAFSMCTALTELNLSEGLESIEKGAFMFCSSLTSVKLPSTLKSIGQAAFGSCSSLQSISIPAGTETIASNAFSGCTALTSVTLPRKFESQISQIFGTTATDTITFTYID